MAVIVTGELSVAQRLQDFPVAVRRSLAQRIRALTDDLYARVRGAAPVRTGKLRSEIVERVYDDTGTRVGGYVSVYAPGDAKEYPKAATLEYGSNAARRIFAKSTSLEARRRKSTPGERMTKAVHLNARRYLRGPLADVAPTVQRELEAAVAQAIDDAEAATE